MTALALISLAGNLYLFFLLIQQKKDYDEMCRLDERIQELLDAVKEESDD